MRNMRWRTVLLALVASGVYANSLGGALLYDDIDAVVTNAWVHAGAPLPILTGPSWWGEDEVGSLWRPVTTLTFAANYAIHGLAPLG